MKQPASVQVSMRVMKEIDVVVREQARNTRRSMAWVYQQGVIALMGDRLPWHVRDMADLWEGDVEK